MKIATRIAAGLSSMLAVGAAYAQTAPTTPVELLTANSGTFVDDTKAVLFAGAGLMIGALLIRKLVNLVIQFFQRG